MRSSEYLRLLRSIPGVVRAELAPEDLVQSVAEMEASITRASAGMKLRNSGMSRCLERGMKAVIFCDSTFQRPEAITIRMVTDDGVEIGHDVPPSRMEEFKARDDVIWVASTFIMYLDRIGDQDATMVMESCRLVVDGAPEDTAADMFYPSVSSAHMINSRFAVDAGQEISNAIVGVDGIEMDDAEDYRMVEMPAESIVGGVFDRGE